MVERNVYLKGLEFLRKNEQFLKFGIVGASGTIVNTVILWALTSFTGMYYLLAAAISTETSIISNFLGNDFFTFRKDRKGNSFFRKFFSFQFISLGTIFGTLSLLWILTSLFGIKYLLIWNLVAIFVIFLANFHLNKKITWGSSKKSGVLVLALFVSGLVFVSGLGDGLDSDFVVFENGTNESLGNETNVTVPDLNMSLNETDSSENETGGNESVLDFSIVSNSSNLNSSNGTYFMNELEVAEFFVELNSSGDVEWFIEDSLVETTANMTNHSFEWYPGVLGVGTEMNDFNISARSVEDQVSWNVKVYDVLNPFFDPDSGTSGSLLHVNSRDSVEGFGGIVNLSVVIFSDEGTKSFELEPDRIDNVTNNVTEWSIFIDDSDFFSGTNYLSKIILDFENESSREYGLPTNGTIYRAFEKIVEGGSGTGGGSSGGSSGGGGGIKEDVDLVYVSFDKNILGEREVQRIYLDAKANVRVKSVSVFLNRSGELIELSLHLVNGDGSYGTWERMVSLLPAGLYEIVYVDITGANRDSYERFRVDERTFYVLGSEVSPSEELGLIYTVLEKGEVSEAGNLSFRLDARDFYGVENVTAVVSKSKPDKETSFSVIDLSLVSGEKKYGTWEGFIFVDEPYSTFKVENITLSNLNSSRTYEINDRSVYANSKVEDLVYDEVEGSGNFFTGLVVLGTDTFGEGENSLALIGFLLFGLIGVIYFFGNKIQKKISSVRGIEDGS